MSEVKIPKALTDILSDMNFNEIKGHDTDEELINWLSVWDTEVKRELDDFANNHALYEQGKADTKSDIAKECKYLLACGMGKKKSLEHLIKILEKELK